MLAQRLKTTKASTVIAATLLLTALFSTFANGLSLFSVMQIEKDNSRLIATSNFNYALTSPKFATKNWRTVSVNGDSVSIVLTSGQVQQSSLSQLDAEDRAFINSIKDDITNGNSGYSQMSGSTSSTFGSGGNVISSSSNSGGYSTSSSSSGFTSMNNGDQISVSSKDDNNFSISKSSLPFNWSQVFVNNDLVTVVTKSGEVFMRPLTSMDADQQTAISQLKVEMKNMQAAQAQQFHDTMQNSMDMVSNMFGNIMGSLPRPPAYNTGNAFGNNFPFGPNNSPFSAAAGWPFAGSSFPFGGARR